MSAAATVESSRLGAGEGKTAARLVVVGLLVGVTLLACAMLVSSVLATGSLTARLAGSGGEVRAGSYTQDLVAHLAERLRLASAVLLALVVGLTVVRRAFERCVSILLADLRAGIGWPSPAIWLTAGGPMLLALGVRLVFLGQPMRYDEALTFNEFASRPLYYGLSFYPDPNNHLLNTLLTHLAFVGLGNQPWALRLPALLGGVLLVPATYWLAGFLYGRRAALLSATLVAVSSYLVEYSTNARGYTLQALCFVVMLGLVTVAIRRESPSALLLAGLVAALGAYALPTMLYGVLIVFVWLGLDSWRTGLTGIRAGQLGQATGAAANRSIRHKQIRSSDLAVSGLLLGLVVALLYLPVMLISGADKLAANRFVLPLNMGELATELPRSLERTWGFWNRDVPAPIAAALGVGFLVAVGTELRRGRVPLGLLAPLVCLAAVVVQRVAPFERVWLFLLPLYFVIAAGGLVHLADMVSERLGGLPSVARARSSMIVAAGALVALLVAWLVASTLGSGSILASTETGAFPDAAAVTSSLRGRLGPADAVVTQVPASLPELQYYFPRAGLAIDALVRAPGEAAHLYVVTPPTDTPVIAGWADPIELQRFPGATLFELERT